MRIAAFGADFDALHVVRVVLHGGYQIGRDRFAKAGHADARVVFVERSEERLASDDIDVNAGTLIVPELVLKWHLGRSQADDGKFLRLQPMAHDIITRHRAVRIESGARYLLFVRDEKEVNRAGGEHRDDADTDIRAERRFFFVSDSAA